MGIQANDVVKVSIGLIVSVAMVMVLAPILDTVKDTLDDDTLGTMIDIIPVILVVVILIMTIGPVMKNRF